MVESQHVPEPPKAALVEPIPSLQVVPPAASGDSAIPKRLWQALLVVTLLALGCAVATGNVWAAPLLVFLLLQVAPPEIYLRSGRGLESLGDAISTIFARRK